RDALLADEHRPARVVEVHEGHRGLPLAALERRGDEERDEERVADEERDEEGAPAKERDVLAEEADGVHAGMPTSRRKASAASWTLGRRPFTSAPTRCSRSPSKTARPFARTSMRSASRAASSTDWVEKRRARPSSRLSPESQSQRRRRWSGLRVAV